MRILLLADIHIGTIKDIDYNYNTLVNIIDKEITFKPCDAVVILGDYFDRLFKVNEDYVALAINVMSYLVRVCIKSNTKIRIVYGTESHEMNQYRLFNHFLSSKTIDIKLFTTCTEEELFPGVNVLYVPEEYIDTKYEFYKNTIYSGKKYDYIFGHGVITEAMPAMVGAARESDTINVEAKVPHFNAGELSKAAKMVVFGHYHVYTQMDNVYYLGSLNRWCFGEETTKYYGVITDGQIEFIENKDAYVYKTYEFESDSSVYDSSDNILNEISKIKEENKELFNGDKTGKIRLIFHLPKEVDPSFKENLKTILFNDKIISTLLKESLSETVEENEEVVEDELAFIIDNSIKVPDKIYSYIGKTRAEIPFSIKDLEHYIYDPLEI